MLKAVAARLLPRRAVAAAVRAAAGAAAVGTALGVAPVGGAVIALYGIGSSPIAAQAPAQPARAVGATDVSEPATPATPAFDHSLFDAQLRLHVKNGLVDYAAFRNNAEFSRYLASLKSANLAGYEEAERIAFWLNVYNAYTIQLVATRGETESIRNINKSFGFLKLKGPWSEAFVQAAGKTMTLDDVQYRVLQHDFSEPRIHFAMSLAALGGPRLRSEAYTGALLDDQLEDQTRKFVHERSKARMDTAYRTVFVSPVIARFRSDFAESSAGVGRFLAEYYPPGPERAYLVPPKRTPTPEPPPAPPADRRDTAKARADRAAREAQRRRDFWYLRVSELPFDWTLDIQKMP